MERRLQGLGSIAQCCLLCLACAALLAAGLDTDRTLYRSQAKRWKTAEDEAKRSTKSAVKQFLEERGQALNVPMEVDVYLVGFNGDGGYGYTLEASKLSAVLASAVSSHCPTAWDTGKELGVCFHPNFQVLGGQELPEVSTLLRQLEAELKAAMIPITPSAEELMAGTTPNATYTVEASRLEPIFARFMDAVYADEQRRADAAAAAGMGDGGSSNKEEAGPHAWHRHNAIFVLNPSKVRVDPRLDASAAQAHAASDFFAAWKSGMLDEARLHDEDGHFTYRYCYNGAGESATWLSAHNYVVIDVSAGPTEFGPAISRGGSVSQRALPSVKEMLTHILDEIKALPAHSTSWEAALKLAQSHGQYSLFSANLASAVLAATKHVFMPDIRAQHIEWAPTVVVPIVVIADHDLGPVQKGLTYVGEGGDFHDINTTAVEAALGRMLDEQQQALVFTAAHRLHDHRALASALHKASRSTAQAVYDPTAQPSGNEAGSGEAGFHVQSSTFIDSDALLQEFALAADVLTIGLIEGAHIGGSHADASHHLSSLRHNGTRVLPVYVLSLRNAPDDVVLSSRELLAASHDSVIVLQLRGAEKWGVQDEFYTGHVANGKRVVTDGRDSTRHVIAGLAQALAGLVPPYERLPPGADHPIFDWRWAVGATPFGPYSNHPGLSTTEQSIARRNLLIAPAAAALETVQERLSAADAFVAEHFSGPWEAGIGLEPGEGHHWLHAAAKERHGFNASLHPDEVADMEHMLQQVASELEMLSLALFTHQFKAAGRIIETSLLKLASSFDMLCDRVLEAAEEVMRCCALKHGAGFSAALVTVLACAGAAAAFFMLLLVGLMARGSRKKMLAAVGLPTYGLPTYSSRQRAWS